MIMDFSYDGKNHIFKHNLQLQYVYRLLSLYKGKAIDELYSTQSYSFEPSVLSPILLQELTKIKEISDFSFFDLKETKAQKKYIYTLIEKYL